MAQQKSFGRRAQEQAPARRADNPVTAIATAPVSVEAAYAPDTVDDELAQWKAERRRSRGLSIVPWRPLYLIASASFGIVSFVLPASVSDWMNWLLYGLAGVALFAWFQGRKRA